MHYTVLDENHHIGQAKLIDKEWLRRHLERDHGVTTKGVTTKGDLGKFHLLVHAVLANDDLRQLLELPEGYGKGTGRKY